MTEDPWAELRRHAVDAAAHAYAPYSGLHVGAAARTDDGRIVTGCNVENVSYGLTLCAECGVVSQLHRSGGGRLTEIVAEPSVGRLRLAVNFDRDAGFPEVRVEERGLPGFQANPPLHVVGDEAHLA